MTASITSLLPLAPDAKNARPTPPSNLMKRKLTYLTDDGQTFETRALAVSHEINLVRRHQLETCLKACIPTDQTLTLELITTAMLDNSIQFAAALSARAAKRARGGAGLTVTPLGQRPSTRSTRRKAS